MTSNGHSHYQPMIRDMPQGERPRERLREFGSKPLSNTELIAILLRTGLKGENVLSLSSRLLSDFGGLAGLGRATFAELCAARGLSEAKACHLAGGIGVGPPVHLHGAGRAGGHQLPLGRGQSTLE